MDVATAEHVGCHKAEGSGGVVPLERGVATGNRRIFSRRRVRLGVDAGVLVSEPAGQARVPHQLLKSRSPELIREVIRLAARIALGVAARPTGASVQEGEHPVRELLRPPDRW